MKQSKAKPKQAETPSECTSKSTKKTLKGAASSRLNEKTLHFHVWQWMQKNKPYAMMFHVPNGEARGWETGAKLRRMGVVPGVADFLLFAPNHCIAIELKSGAGKLSAAQEKWGLRWAALGTRYTYFVCRSLEEFIQFMDQFE